MVTTPPTHTAPATTCTLLTSAWSGRKPLLTVCPSNQNDAMINTMQASAGRERVVGVQRTIGSPASSGVGDVSTPSRTADDSDRTTDGRRTRRWVRPREIVPPIPTASPIPPRIRNTVAKPGAVDQPDVSDSAPIRETPTYSIAAPTTMTTPSTRIADRARRISARLPRKAVATNARAPSPSTTPRYPTRRPTVAVVVPGLELSTVRNSSRV